MSLASVKSPYREGMQQFYVMENLWRFAYQNDSIGENEIGSKELVALINVLAS